MPETESEEGMTDNDNMKRVLEKAIEHYGKKYSDAENL